MKMVIWKVCLCSS